MERSLEISTSIESIKDQLKHRKVVWRNLRLLETGNDKGRILAKGKRNREGLTAAFLVRTDKRCQIWNGRKGEVL